MAIEKIEHIATELTKALIIANPTPYVRKLEKAIDLREDLIKILEEKFPPKRWGPVT